MKNVKQLLLVTAWITLGARSGWAQTVYGSVAGIVTDASGRAMPDAAVTLTSMGTNETRTMQSEASGGYTFVNILPGNYRLEAQKTGFKAFRRENILVEVGSSFKVDIQMQVGAISQTVEVTSTTPLLQAQSSDLGQVVESR